MSTRRAQVANIPGVVGGLVVGTALALVLFAIETWRTVRGGPLSSTVLPNSGKALVLTAFLFVLLLLIGVLIQTSKWLELFLSTSTLVVLCVAGFAALVIAPEERTMGLIQRIFYFHVSSAWTAFVAFFVAFVANIAFILQRDSVWDCLGISAAEMGLAFTSVVLVTGPIWAHPVWGVWWAWDARLTLTFVLWLLYVSYLLLRTLMEDPDRRALVSAIFGIFAFLDVPLVYMSIRWWRTQHPQPVILGGSGSGLNPQMWMVLLTCWASLLALFVLLLRQRYRIEVLRLEVGELKLEEGDQ